MSATGEPAHAPRVRRRKTIVAACAIGCLALLLLLSAFAWRGWSRPPPLVMSAPRDWQTIDAGGRFTFRAPADLRPEPVRGIDSFVGIYRSESLTLGFDYGQYSNSLQDDGKPDYQQRRVTVSGFEAKVVQYREPASPHGYVTAIHFPDLGDQRTRLTVETRGETPGDQEDALRILSSLEIATPPR